MIDICVCLYYLIGCILLLPGSILFAPEFAAYGNWAIFCYLIAAGSLTIGALINWVFHCYKPLRKHLYYLFNVLGGVFFFSGSALAWPPNSDYISMSPSLTFYYMWLFRLGSSSYIAGNVIFIYDVLFPLRGPPDVLEDILYYEARFVKKKKSMSCEDRAWIVCETFYLVGSIVFITGGLMLEADIKGYAIVYISASVLFVVGALVYLLNDSTACFRRR